jgi:hypothetical protein
MEIAKGKIAGNNVLICVDKLGFIGLGNDEYQYYLLVLDTGSGILNVEEYKKRFFIMQGELREQFLNARGKNLNLIEFLSTKQEILDWLEQMQSVLIHGDGTGQMMVEFKYPENTEPQEPTPGLELPPGMNTLTMPELEDAFSRIVAAKNGQVYKGIGNGRIGLEDSLPWFEIVFDEKGSVKKAKDFCQQLADEMNVRILFNRIESDTKEFTLYGVMDIDYEEVEKGCTVVPALSRDGDWAEFMEDYGTPIMPTHTKKKSKKMKM